MSSSDDGESSLRESVSEKTMDNRGYEGHIDRIKKGRVFGWAWQSGLPNEPIALDLYIDGKHESGIGAFLYRLDLESAGKGNGRHAFEVELPSRCYDGKTHEIRLCYQGTMLDLYGSPQSVSIKPGTPPISNFQKQKRIPHHPKVAVIIPIYNKAPFLRQCLQSVSNQSLTDIEIICIDDCSTDGSTEIVAEHSREDHRVLVIRNETKTGPGFARNLGISRASAPFVQFTDADDLLPPQSLETLFKLATADGVPLVRGSLGNFSDPTGNIWFDERQLMSDRHKFSLKEETKLWVPYFHVCFLFSKVFLITNHISYPSLRSGEDPVFLALCLVNAPSLSTSSEVTYLYRRNENGNRSTFGHVMDFICHVKTLKNIYINSQNSQCWLEICEHFYLDDTKALVKRVKINEQEHAEIVRAMKEIWQLSPEGLEF